MRADAEFTHAILTEPSEIVGAPAKPVKVVLDALHVFAITRMPQHNATSIIASAGGHMVVKETIEEAGIIIDNALNAFDNKQEK